MEVLALIGFIILLLLGVPIALVLGFTSIMLILIDGDFSMLNSMPQMAFSGTQNFGLLAIPLFILVGELMSYGGITPRLIKFCNEVIGHFRGGLAYVNVAANMFLASILGSANSQSAVMSRVMVPEMEREGYRRDFSAGLTTSSSLIGSTLPPSVSFIIFGVTGGVSIAGLFLAGIVPSLLLGLAFVIYIYILSIKEDFPKQDKKTSFIQISKSLIRIIPAISIPFIIIFGIISGIMTITESAAVAALIAFLVGVFLYRDLKMKDIPKILFQTVSNSAIVTFLVAMASIFAWILTKERLPQIIGEGLQTVTENPLLFLLLVNVVLLLIGMIMEGLAAMIILIPILLPVAMELGIDPLHFGVIMVFNLALGLLTPPVGTALFITSSIAKVKLEHLIIRVIPFLIIGVILLILITYVPALSTWVPSLLE
ncbi:TRAP transporter large permease [Salicibibacter cibarius]|uniref:TRAP transporter large permease n=1 Tax=Salicibibacter cibarius TaxID=2743000 RepID=A0A7T6Z1T0_9BACI|nr:TRAP transporter large permease [Salicibibacter cibarius]QQK74726.1 TRAP transporter large permease [Salicibibacter cibarius]